MNVTPKANRLHIAVFGKCNSGKSSLINALTGQQAALVSNLPGTTTDPVFKNMELSGIGACVFMDTAGFDDQGEIGEMRVSQTLKVVEQTDIALIVCTQADCSEEIRWLHLLEEKKIPSVLLLNKSDLLDEASQVATLIEKQCGCVPVIVSARQRQGLEDVIRAITRRISPDFNEPQIVGHLVNEGDCVVLVMPQDGQAPKGRLILPQAQTIRELLDKKCVTVCCTPEQFDATLHALAVVPKLIITDSQVFGEIQDRKPEESKLTSFSVLFARQKGDINYFMKSATVIGQLNECSRVLIAEACTHAPQSEDIGRVKIPAMLRKKAGQRLRIDVVSGSDFPSDLSAYSLIIHCGACMFNRKHVMNRVELAKAQGVPMTNYGVAIAYLKGILSRIVCE